MCHFVVYCILPSFKITFISGKFLEQNKPHCTETDLPNLQRIKLGHIFPKTEPNPRNKSLLKVVFFVAHLSPFVKQNETCPAEFKRCQTASL